MQSATSIRRRCIAGGRILAGTSGVALCAALSLPLKAVGTSLQKNTARIAGQRWTVRNETISRVAKEKKTQKDL